MNSVQKGNIGKRHPYAHVFGKIKQDEARHVGISRQHLRWLGDNPNRTFELGSEIRTKLIELLRPEAEHLEILGVDMDKLEQKILRF